MLVDDIGAVEVMNDGTTILEEIDIEHPAAELVVEVAESQADEIGDGTTTAGLLAGELLDEADGLLERDHHPQTIIRGYIEAAGYAKERQDAHDIDADVDDRETLRDLARTAMTGKLPTGGHEPLLDVGSRRSDWGRPGRTGRSRVSRNRDRHGE